MNVIQERLEMLRNLMRERKIDAYLLPTSDFHESGYVGKHFKTRKFITGFTGSAGTAVITFHEACIWMDGRYFVQGAKELKGTSVTMMKMEQDGVPTIEEYLDKKIPEGGCLGFDGRVVNAAVGVGLEDLLEDFCRESGYDCGSILKEETADCCKNYLLKHWDEVLKHY